MKKLKNILQFKYIFFILLIVTVILSIIRVEFKKVNISSEFVGILESYSFDGNKYSFILKNRNKLKCTYYAKDENELNHLKQFEVGNNLQVKGEVSIPNKNTIPNTFNYQKYLKSKNIYKVMNVEKIEVLNNNKNVLYTIKNKIIKRIGKFKSKRYISAFILGDKSFLDEDVKNMYQELGVSHIFAISGMHISLITTILFFILKKIKENLKYFIVILFLLLYVFLTGMQASVLRSVAFFIVSYFNKKYLFNIDNTNIFYIAITILLIIFPNLIFDIGFQYSSIISFSLIEFSYFIKGNYISKSLIISIIAFLVSLPISINNNFQVNIFSIINNLFIVPYISLLLYPLAVITFFIPFLDNVLYLFCDIVELFSKYLFKFNIIIPKMNFIIVIIYYCFLFIFFKTYKKHYLLLSIILVLLLKITIFFDNAYYIYFLDVGQGDSIVIKYKNKTAMIDTGGTIKYKEEEWKRKKEYHITDTTISFLKSIGVTELNYLILTHGDYDHMGEASNMVSKFKVKNVIFNCGKFNNLENELINNLNIKKINFNSCAQVLKFGGYQLNFLNTDEYDNENDNSSVIYFNYNNIKFLFMGDAGVNKEKDLLLKYNLNNIDFLKVGHHGSNTSSSETFIDQINPKYSLISVGKNNRYGHPKESVLNVLKNSKIYRTDLDGTIIIKLNKNRFDIRTTKR